MSIVVVSEIAPGDGHSIGPQEATRVQQWINRVEGRIRRRLPDLDQRMQDPGFAATVRGVVIDVVTRRVDNPQQLRSERVDDYYYDRAGGAAVADLWPTPEEWAELDPTLGVQAFSIRPHFVPGCP